MANRILMDASGLKVSTPGSNVLTQGAGDLAFNSDWSAFSIYMQGTQNVSWSSGGTGNFSANINYGTTFSSPPLCRFELRRGTSNWSLMGGGGNFDFQRSVRLYEEIGGDFTWYSTAFYRLFSNITTTRLELRGQFDEGDFGVRRVPPPTGLTIRYTVFSYNF